MFVFPGVIAMLQERLDRLEQRVKEASELIVHLRNEKEDLEMKYREAVKKAQEVQSELDYLKSIQDQLGFRLENICSHLDNVSEGSMNDAISLYEQKIQENAQDFQAYFKLGNILEKKGLFDKAIEVYRKSIKIKPDFVSAIEHLAFLLEKLNRESEASPLWDKVLALKK